MSKINRSPLQWKLRQQKLIEDKRTKELAEVIIYSSIAGALIGLLVVIAIIRYGAIIN